MAAILVIGGVSACAADSPIDEEEGIESAIDALVGGRGGIVGPVRVEHDRLVVQSDGNESLVSVRPGRALVGGPEPGSTTNPMGYLRRAVSSKRVGDDIVIETQAGALGDVIRSGTVKARGGMGGAAPSLEGTLQTSTVAFSKDALGVEVDDVDILDFQTTFRDPTKLLPVRSFELSRKVRLKHAHFRFKPRIDVLLTMRGGKIDRFDAVAKGEIDAEAQVSIDTTSNIDINKNPAYTSTLKKFLRSPAVSYTAYQSKPFIVYTMPAPPFFTLTGRFNVIIECDVTMTSTHHTEAGMRLNTTAELGARFRRSPCDAQHPDGCWQPAEAPTLTATPTFDRTSKGDVEGRCDVRAELGVYIYDFIGPVLSFTPYVAFGLHHDDGPSRFSAAPGFRFTLAGKGIVPVLGWELFRGDWNFYDKRVDPPLTGTLPF